MWKLALLLAIAADPYGYKTDDLEASLLGTVTSTGLQWPAVNEKLRELKPPARAEAVRVLGKAVRAIAESPAFAKRYNAAVDAQAPKPPTPPESNAAHAAMAKKQLDDAAAQMEKSIAMLPKDQQQKVREAMDKARADQAKAANDTSGDEANKRAYAAQKQQYEADKARFDKERVPLKKALAAAIARFLDATKDVDFDAQTTKGPGGLTVFVESKYEAKPADWKRAFRAGKEATQAARAVAEQWGKAL